MLPYYFGNLNAPMDLAVHAVQQLDVHNGLLPMPVLLSGKLHCIPSKDLYIRPWVQQEQPYPCYLLDVLPQNIGSV